MNSQSTIPSSKTRFVDANWNAIAEPRLAPFSNSDFAIAIAAYEHDDDAAPSPVASAASRAPRPPSAALQPLARHPGLHDPREREAEDERPPDLPGHPQRVRETIPAATWRLSTSSRRAPARASNSLLRATESAQRSCGGALRGACNSLLLRAGGPGGRSGCPRRSTAESTQSARMPMNDGESGHGLSVAEQGLSAQIVIMLMMISMS